jgi:hypothetical protein
MQAAPTVESLTLLDITQSTEEEKSMASKS